MQVFCIDIGNTHTHFALLGPERVTVEPKRIATADIDLHGNVLHRDLAALEHDSPGTYGVAFCSVVPSAGKILSDRLASLPDRPPVFHLTNKTLPPEIRLNYPRPDEIGQDRLANAAAAVFFHRLPCVVIDLGTAVTFDIVSARNGYEGGIIAPGIGIMTRYLHRQTALLPQLSEELVTAGSIGKSTREAMTIGCVLGFRGMLDALLRAVIDDLAAKGETDPHLILTGGCADFLFAGKEGESSPERNKLAGIEVMTVPDLTLQGLAAAFRARNST